FLPQCLTAKPASECRIGKPRGRILAPTGGGGAGLTRLHGKDSLPCLFFQMGSKRVADLFQPFGNARPVRSLPEYLAAALALVKLLHPRITTRRHALAHLILGNRRHWAP